MVIDQERVLAALATGQADFLEILDRLISFETVAPPARNTRPLQEWLAQELEHLGFETQLKDFYPGDALLSAKKSGYAGHNHHNLLLNGHVDVAALADTNRWQTAPFSLVRQSETLFGRGVSDMKGAMAVFVFIFKIFSDLKIDLAGDLLFQAVVGEELGEAGTKTLLENQKDPIDFAIVGDSSNNQFQGQGGVITGWIILKAPHTYHDGNRRQMVQTGGGLKAASMVEKMPVLMAALQQLERYWGITKEYPGFALGSNTINPAYIEGGLHPAFVADECRLWITVHFYPNETVASVTNEVEEAVLAAAKADPWLRDNLPTFTWGGDSMLVDRGEVFPALEIDENQPALVKLAAAYRKNMGQDPVVGMSPSVSDGGWFGHYGIPAVIYGPGDLGQAHSDNEQASLTELMAYAQTMATFILDWCQSEK